MIKQSGQRSEPLLVLITVLMNWLCRLPEEVVHLSSCCVLTGRSKSSGGTDRDASWGSEEGHTWWAASEFGTKTSCRSRPWIWSKKHGSDFYLFIFFLELNNKFLMQHTENKPFHLPRLPMWTLDPWMLRSEGKGLEGVLFGMKDHYLKHMKQVGFLP